MTQDILNVLNRKDKSSADKLAALSELINNTNTEQVDRIYENKYLLHSANSEMFLTVTFDGNKKVAVKTLINDPQKPNMTQSRSKYVLWINGALAIIEKRNLEQQLKVNEDRHQRLYAKEITKIQSAASVRQK